eukprot:XP_024305882.1 uncharacterized protein LOC112268145 [Homo sapiens]
MRGRQWLRKRVEVVCTGRSANTVCAGVRAAGLVEKSPPPSLSRVGRLRLQGQRPNCALCVVLRGLPEDAFNLKGDGRSWLAEVQFVYQGLGGNGGRRVSSDREQHVQRLQRFRFCGDLDCPDRVLAEISTLAKMSSVKLQLLCSQVLKELLGQGIDYKKILKLTADAKFESGDVKATVAVLSFILSGAAKHSVDGKSLASELQQLGLPKEHAASPCCCYEEKQSPLQKHLRVCSLRKVQRNLVPAAVNPYVMIFLPALFRVLVLAAVFGQVVGSKTIPGFHHRQASMVSRWSQELLGLSRLRPLPIPVFLPAVGGCRGQPQSLPWEPALPCLNSSDLPALDSQSAAIIGVSHCTQPSLDFEIYVVHPDSSELWGNTKDEENERRDTSN